MARLSEATGELLLHHHDANADGREPAPGQRAASEAVLSAASISSMRRQGIGDNIITDFGAERTVPTIKRHDELPATRLVAHWR